MNTCKVISHSMKTNFQWNSSEVKDLQTFPEANLNLFMYILWTNNPWIRVEKTGHFNAWITLWIVFLLAPRY